MSRKHIMLLLAAAFIFNFSNAQPGSWRQVGQAGIWVNTLYAASCNAVLYSVEKNGALFRTDPATGVYQGLDQGNYINTTLLLAGDNYLTSIEKDGSLYKTDLIAMRWKRIGTAGGWAKTIAGALLNGKLYTIESSGVLYVTDLETGVWTDIGNPEFQNTRFLFAASNNLYSIEKDGSLYIINPADGKWKIMGKPGEWANTIAGTVMNDKLYTVESNGSLFETNLTTGTWVQLGKPEFSGTKFLFAGWGKIYSIEASGTLYEINVN